MSETMEPKKEINIEEIKVIKLKRSHLYEFSRILDKIEFSMKISENMTKEEVGGEIISTFFRKIHKAENEVDNFLSKLTNIEKELIDDMDIDIYIKLWMKVFSNEKFKSFFSKLPIQT